MFSIVVVYNNRRALDEILLKSLAKQTAKFELILVDNSNGKYKSAAEALNFGGKQATSDYILFVHQDVDLDSALWLENTEKTIQEISDLGIAGVAGMSENGTTNEQKGRGIINDCGDIWHWSNPVQEPEEVQTLDECLLIIPRLVFNQSQFDEEKFSGWHCFGSDYCLSVRNIGKKAYVIPAFVYHRSLRSNVENLLNYQRILFDKHKSKYRRIYTTSGEISKKTLRIGCVLNLIKPIYKRIFPDWTVYLKSELVNCKTVLDLGCGFNSPAQVVRIPYSIGVELFNPYLQESKKKGIHSQYIKADIGKIEFRSKSFDAVLALDALEHLTKKDGHILIDRMRDWAKERIIIVTPNEHLWQDGYDKNPLQEHKSGWSVEELRELGFKVNGIGGWKRLKGYKGSLRHDPTLLWVAISNLTQKITYRSPKHSFVLLAVKQLAN